MSCTCGAGAVQGGHSSWCDWTEQLTKLEEIVLEDPPAFNSNWFNTPVISNYTYFKLCAPATKKTVEDAIIDELQNAIITEKQMNKLKATFPFHSIFKNSKETVNFVTQTFEEL